MTTDRIKRKRIYAKKKVETVIGGSDDEETIRAAVGTYLFGFLEFLLKGTQEFLPAIANPGVQKAIKDRVLGMQDTTVDVIKKINQRAMVLRSPEYAQLLDLEIEQWDPEREGLHTGMLTCVDAGVPREAVGGPGTKLGRTLAGDLPIFFSRRLGGFRLEPTTFHKKILHDFKSGSRALLEILIEHTGCGRRNQMNRNLDTRNTVAQQYRVVFSHLEQLTGEFEADKGEATQKLNDFKQLWQSGAMLADGGVWAGTLVKVAQRQAIRTVDQSQDVSILVPIQLYDKHDGNLYAGLDNLAVLSTQEVLAAGGFTDEALGQLAKNEVIFSMRHWASKTEVQQRLEQLLPEKGSVDFSELQQQWLSTKQTLVTGTDSLWKAFRSTDTQDEPIREMVRAFIDKSNLKRQAEDAKVLDAAERRLTHQLFRALVYSWLLNTFEHGNPPGKHMEDHLATGEPAEHGVMEHLPLGQGDMQPPNFQEIFTGYTVLLHSRPGREGHPVLLMMKHDTSRESAEPMTTEETERTMQDFRELLKLWPYIVLGDIVPVMAIRSKHHGGVDRVALSPVLAFSTIVDLLNMETGAINSLPKFVPAVNGRGEMVFVPAQDVLKTGAKASDLKEFRGSMLQVADTYSDKNLQDLITQQQRL